MQREGLNLETPGDFEAAVRRTEGIQPWRRVFHATCGIAIAAFVAYGGLDRTVDLVCLGGALAASLALDWARLASRRANTTFFRWFSVLVSPREARRIASSTWFLMGALVTLAIAPESLFMPALLVLALADPAASVVGRLWGRHRLGKGSWEGTVAFFVVATAVLVPFVGAAIALPAAAAVASFEVLPIGIDDNLTVPPITALALNTLIVYFT